MGTVRTLNLRTIRVSLSIKNLSLLFSPFYSKASQKTRILCCSAKMVKEMIMFTAVLDTLTALQPQGGCDDPNLPYYFKLKCFNCGYVSQKDSCVVRSVTVLNGKGVTNLVQQCKSCSRVGTVTLIPGRGIPLMLEKSKAGQYAPLVLVDYQGLEPVEFSFGKGWKAESEMGTPFNNIDLAEGEFSGYCDKGRV